MCDNLIFFFSSTVILILSLRLNNISEAEFIHGIKHATGMQSAIPVSVAIVDVYRMNDYSLQVFTKYVVHILLHSSPISVIAERVL